MTITLSQNFLDILFPRRCPLCGEVRPPGSALNQGVCRSCQAVLLPLAGPFCTVCGAPLISELSLCLHCREEEGRSTEEGQGRFSYDLARSLFPYRGPARELMYQYKFRGRKFLASYLAWRIQECYGSLIEGFAIVPAPAEPRNLKKRGWDPVLVLARALARINGNDVEPVLGRKRSISQKGLNREERKENLKGKIYVRKSLKSRHVAILDDIWTTGATAQICSAVLKEFNPEKIMVLTVCRD